MAKKTHQRTSCTDGNSGFVDDGYQRLTDGIETQVRAEIEELFAAEWNSSGLFQRWFLQREMDRIVADRIAVRTKHISPNSLF